MHSMLLLGISILKELLCLFFDPLLLFLRRWSLRCIYSVLPILRVDLKKEISGPECRLIRIASCPDPRSKLSTIA